MALPTVTTSFGVGCAPAIGPRSSRQASAASSAEVFRMVRFVIDSSSLLVTWRADRGGGARAAELQAAVGDGGAAQAGGIAQHGQLGIELELRLSPHFDLRDHGRAFDERQIGREGDEVGNAPGGALARFEERLDLQRRAGALD